MPPETDSTADSAMNWVGLRRRPLLKALGVGAGVSLGTTGAVAATGIDEHTEDQVDSEINPLYGLAVPDAEAIPDEIEPEYEVDLQVEEATDERPELFVFDPTGLAVEAGETVQFTFSTPDHTVTAYHPAHGFQQRVPEDVPPFSSPIVNVMGAWLYQFDEPGVYDLYCGPHHTLGMVMRVVVGDISGDELPDYVDSFEGSEGPPPLLAPFNREFLEDRLDTYSEANDEVEWVWLTPQEVLETDALDPESIQDAGAVSFEEVRADIDRFSD